MFVNNDSGWDRVVERMGKTADVKTMESTGLQNQCSLQEVKSKVKAHLEAGKPNFNYTYTF